LKRVSSAGSGLPASPGVGLSSGGPRPVTRRSWCSHCDDWPDTRGPSQRVAGQTERLPRPADREPGHLASDHGFVTVRNGRCEGVRGRLPRRACAGLVMTKLPVTVLIMPVDVVASSSIAATPETGHAGASGRDAPRSLIDIMMIPPGERLRVCP
jgi:hypothetical protein